MAACAVDPDALVVRRVEEHFVFVEVNGARLSLAERGFGAPLSSEIACWDLNHFRRGLRSSLAVGGRVAAREGNEKHDACGHAGENTRSPDEFGGKALSEVSDH